jgi:uncharacterized protein (DUF427 family)
MTERVRVERAGQVRVHLGGKIIGESDGAYVVHETGLPDRYYLPRGDVRATLSEGTGDGTCPWKGKWRHLDVEVDGRRIANGAWTYFEVTPVAEPIRDHVAFYENKVDRIEHG